MSKSRNDRKLLVILIGVLAIVLAGAVYYYLIYPKTEAKDRIIYSVEMLKSDKMVLEKQIERATGLKEETQTETELRQKLPPSRELDQLIHTLSDVEKGSGSVFQTITFNTYDAPVAASSFIPPTETGEGVDSTSGNEDSDEDKASEANPPITTIDVTQLPPQLKLISLNATVTVKNYNLLLVLLEKIEAIERVVRIDSVAFSQNTGEEDITVSIQLTTFYLEDGVK